ncbi:hypothetical protein BDZ97DRAFT_1916423 [Flammula alnicola]|nr:hypothetical protein BDZ97DRAFT_1916423 [Flammula alnicola]
MFSRLSRLPLRRSLHTGPGAARSAGAFGRPARVALGVSAATAAYLTWQLTRERNQISLDSPQASRSSERSLTTKTSRLPEAPSEPTLSSASTSTAESDVFVPDVPSDSEDVPNLRQRMVLLKEKEKVPLKKVELPEARSTQ